MYFFESLESSLIFGTWLQLPAPGISIYSFGTSLGISRRNNFSFFSLKKAELFSECQFIMRCAAVSHYKYSLSKTLSVSVGLPGRHCMPLSGSPSRILSCTGTPTLLFDFLKIDKILR